VGVGLQNSAASFDNISVQKLPPDVTYIDVEDFTDGQAQGFEPVSGSWEIVDEGYVGSVAGSEFALSTFALPVAPSAFLGVATELTTDGVAGLVFDHYEDGRFKYVAIDSSADQVIIGHYTEKSGFVVDAVADFAIDAGVAHQLELGLSGTTLSVTVDGQVVLGHVFNSLLNDGQLGALTLTGHASFTSISSMTDDASYADNQHADIAKAQWAGSSLLEQEQVGLLSVVSNEVGHYLDFEHGEFLLMDDVLPVSERRVPDLQVVSNYRPEGEADYLALDEQAGELLAQDFSNNAGQVTREILAGRMVDWSR
jgi:hypothetical protein